MRDIAPNSIYQSAVFGGGMRPADRTIDPDIIEMRAYRAVPAILRGLPAASRFSDFVAALAVRYPTLPTRDAIRLAKGAVLSRARQPLPRRGPHPTMLFETISTPPSELDWATHRRAIALQATMEVSQ